jgi:hypothetical protein
LIKAYEYEYNPNESNDQLIVLGMRYGGILFFMDGNKVSSIYIATGAYTGVSDPREIG